MKVLIYKNIPTRWIETILRKKMIKKGIDDFCLPDVPNCVVKIEMSQNLWKYKVSQNNKILKSSINYCNVPQSNTQHQKFFWS